LLSRRERLPTVTLVFILTPRGYRRQQGTFQLQCAGAPTQQLWFKEVPLWEQEPAPWWEEVPGLMALYPLYRHGRPPREAIEHAMTVIEARTTDSLQRADFLAYLQTFGRLAYPDLDVASIIGSEKMKESPFLREIMQEAAVSTCRDHIRRAIELRFGAEAANELAPPVETITDLTQLELLLDKAMICPALDDFRTALTHPRRARRRRRTGG